MSATDPSGFDQPKAEQPPQINVTLIVNDGELNEARLDMSGQTSVVCRVLAAAADAVEDELR